jgi:hypothetical protein
MRPARPSLVALVLLAAAHAAAAAPERRPEVPVAGRYQARFAKVSDNCKDTGMSLGTTTVELREPKSGKIEVTIAMVPDMAGMVSRGGKFKAEAKKGRTGIAGVDGRFSIAGRVEAGEIQFLFIAEYYKGDKPLCTQSWNAKGPKG